MPRDVPLLRGTLRLALVLGLHAALITWLFGLKLHGPDGAALLRMDVRTIESLPEPPKPLPPPKLQPQAPVRRAEALPPPPVMTAAADAPAVASNFAVSPQPPAPVRHPVAAAPVQAPVVNVAPLPPPPPPPVVTAARFDADYLNNPAPEYPSLSRRRREEGRVHLLVRVNADGSAAEVSVQGSSGFQRLDDAAQEAVRRWRFVPARRGEQPIAASVVVPIVFRLE